MWDSMRGWLARMVGAKPPGLTGLNRFEGRGAMPIVQRRWVRGPHGNPHEAAWEVDLEVLAATQPWARDEPRVLKEIRAMEQMYPAWTLTLAQGMEALRRSNAPGDSAIPAAGAWRWASDGAEFRRPPYTVLAWEGLLPAPLKGLKGVAERLHGHYPVEMVQGAPWTAVPVRVAYATDYPQGQPFVFYDMRWIQTLNLPLGSAGHLLGGGLLCLFYINQWKRTYTVADVLSQRVINHLYSTLKIAAGMNPHEAFIGRIHAEAWKPER